MVLAMCCCTCTEIEWCFFFAFVSMLEWASFRGNWVHESSLSRRQNNHNTRWMFQNIDVYYEYGSGCNSSISHFSRVEYQGRFNEFHLKKLSIQWTRKNELMQMNKCAAVEYTEWSQCNISQIPKWVLWMCCYLFELSLVLPHWSMVRKTIAELEMKCPHAQTKCCQFHFPIYSTKMWMVKRSWIHTAVI